MGLAVENNVSMATNKDVRARSGVASYGALGYMPPSTSNNFIFISLWSTSDSQLSK